MKAERVEVAALISFLGPMACIPPTARLDATSACRLECSSRRHSRVVRAYSSVVEHCVDIAGVGSSILPTPTIRKPCKQLILLGFCTFGSGHALDTPEANHPAYPGRIGKFWANSGHGGHANPWADVRSLPCFDIRRRLRSGTSRASVRGRRLDGSLETMRVRVSSRCQVLGWGLVRADRWATNMSSKDPSSARADRDGEAALRRPRRTLSHVGRALRELNEPLGQSPPDTGIAITEVRPSDAAPDGARAPPLRQSSGDAFILTPRDIAMRLQIKSADPVKWMRRLFKKHDVPFLDVCGHSRATEGQYQTLLEKMTCSPIAPVGRTESSMSADQSRSATNPSRSKSSVQEQVTQMLRRT